jgi:hypothetical protein
MAQLASETVPGKGCLDRQKNRPCRRRVPLGLAISPIAGETQAGVGLSGTHAGTVLLPSHRESCCPICMALGLVVNLEDEIMLYHMANHGPRNASNA